MKKQLGQFLLALQFLTRIPVARWIAFRAEDLPRSAKYFPLVGLLLGAISALVFFACAKIFPASIALLFTMLANVLVTGALHEDGLADTADGLGGGATREHVLEIMRDSRIGAYGAVALWFALTLRFFALQFLMQWLVAFDAPLWRVLLAAPLLSRCAGVALLATCKNARPDSATSAPFIGAVSKLSVLFALVYTMFITVLLLGKWSIAAFCGVALTAALCRAQFQRRLGGITGDCLGAAIHLCELSVFLALVVIVKIFLRRTFAV